MRIELGSHKLAPNIIPVDDESQLLCAFTIEQSIVGGRPPYGLITPRKSQFWVHFTYEKSLLGGNKICTRERKDRQLIQTVLDISRDDQAI